MARYTHEQIANAIEKKMGNISQAARALGMSRSQMNNRINASKKLTAIVEDSREELADIAESALRKQVLDGNITAIIFTLKTVGKSRGYVERQELANPDGSNIFEGLIININDKSED